MVKVKQFDSSIFCLNPRKAMQKYINKNGIRKEQIVSMIPLSSEAGGMSSLSYVLTYDDGQ